MRTDFDGATMRRGQKGTILIVVLGVLFLLALLATTFATLQSVERRISRNFTDETRAKLIAQSGVETAVERLSTIVQNGWFKNGKMDTTWVYYGSQTDETQPPQFAVPLIKARNPSFAWEDEAVQNPYDANRTPKQIQIEGQQVGFTGIMMSGTYAKNGDLFTTRVMDCQAMINVNDGVPWGPQHAVSMNLKRILNRLGEQPTINIPDLGDRILLNRPAQGYRNKFELLRCVDYDQAKFKKFKDFVTVWSWKNDSVANPVPLAGTPDVLQLYGGIEYMRPIGPDGKIYRYGHGKNYSGQQISMGLKFYIPGWNDTPSTVPQYCAVWTYDALNPQWIELVERAPVNVNTASREVLVALLADLEGFFLLSRRRPSPRDIFYKWLPHLSTYDPSYPADTNWFYGNRENMSYTYNDDLGFLYRTLKYISSASGSTGLTGSAGTISAEKVADEILACRDRRPSPNMPTVNYGTAPFGGPFRSWAQFNEFCDNLVKGGLINDTRNIFFDYKPQVSQVPGWFGGSWWDISAIVTVPSTPQKRWASLAAADVLKANFNPNLHLNELNHDRNLTTHVDKTDLLVNSTEFCFTPMGFFEIESIGYVLRPRDLGTSGGTTLAGGNDALTQDNEIIALKELYTVAKLYDAYYIGTQKQFYKGEFGKRKSNPTTNNGRAVETGPEPDNGPAPGENEWDGYVCLPTNLGHFTDPNFEKPKNSLWTCDQTGKYPGCTVAPWGSSEFGSKIHAHFQFDHSAHYHMAGAADAVPIGQFQNAGEYSLNYPDKTESVPGPYNPPTSKLSGMADKYRLCRSYRIPPNAPGSSTSVAPTPPSAFMYAPLDLRLDGAYVEPHSAFGYNIWNSKFVKMAQVSMWWKPNFTPEVTGRIRTLFSTVNYNDISGPGIGMLNIFYPLPFSAHWMPSYHSYEEPQLPKYGEPARKTCVVYGIGADTRFVSIGGGIGGLSPSLNHEWEPAFTTVSEDWNRFVGSDGKFNHLRAHEWMHIMLQAEAGKGFKSGGASFPPRIKMWINGRLLPGTDQVLVHVNDGPEDLTMLHGRSVRIGGEYSQALPNVPRCYFADGTIDEVFIWLSNLENDTQAGIDGTQQIFLFGRYYRVKDTDAMDGRYTSDVLPLDLGKRVLPPASAVNPPGGGAGTSETTLTVPAPAPKKKLYAIQWTCYAEDYTQGAEPDGTPRIKPVMWDYFPTYSGQMPNAMSPANLPDKNDYPYETVCDIYVQVGDKEYGPYRNEVWSPIRDSHQVGGPVATGEGGGPVQVDNNEPVRFIAKFRVGGATINTVLLATPVLDDVTLFYVQGSTVFYNFIEVRIT